MGAGWDGTLVWSAGGVLVWYVGVLVWYGGVLVWYGGVLVWYGGVVCWYAGMVWCGVMQFSVVYVASEIIHAATLRTELWVWKFCVPPKQHAACLFLCTACSSLSPR